MIVGAGFALTSLIYTAVNINAINEQKVAEISRAEQIYSAEFVKAWYSSEMKEYNVKVREFISRLRKSTEEKEKDTILQELRNNHDSFMSLLSVLNLFEHVAQDIDFELADEDYLKAFFRSIVATYYHGFMPLVQKVRTDMRSERLFCRFEAMAKRWDQK